MTGSVSGSAPSAVSPSPPQWLGERQWYRSRGHGQRRSQSAASVTGAGQLGLGGSAGGSASANRTQAAAFRRDAARSGALAGQVSGTAPECQRCANANASRGGQLAPRPASAGPMAPPMRPRRSAGNAERSIDRWQCDGLACGQRQWLGFRKCQLQRRRPAARPPQPCPREQAATTDTEPLHPDRRHPARRPRSPGGGPFHGVTSR